MVDWQTKQIREKPRLVNPLVPYLHDIISLNYVEQVAVLNKLKEELILINLQKICNFYQLSLMELKETHRLQAESSQLFLALVENY